MALREGRKTMDLMINCKGCVWQLEKAHFVSAFVPTIPAFHYAICYSIDNSADKILLLQWLVELSLNWPV